MFGLLRGLLVEKNAESILIDILGVGYEVEVPASTLCSLPDINQEVKLFILTHVREDAIRLFGFISSFDKKVFSELISVSGVGPKAALALLGPIEGYELCEIITSGQISKLTNIPGIGPKTAERLILELKQKLQKLLLRKKDEIEIQKTSMTSAIAGSIINDQKISSKLEKKLLRRNIIEDLKGALNNLGYKDKQYENILNGVEQRMELGEEISLEIALRESLRKLSERTLQKK